MCSYLFWAVGLRFFTIGCCILKLEEQPEIADLQWSWCLFDTLFWHLFCSCLGSCDCSGQFLFVSPFFAVLLAPPFSSLTTLQTYKCTAACHLEMQRRNLMQKCDAKKIQKTNTKHKSKVEVSHQKRRHKAAYFPTTALTSHLHQPIPSFQLSTHSLLIWSLCPWVIFPLHLFSQPFMQALGSWGQLIP